MYENFDKMRLPSETSSIEMDLNRVLMTLIHIAPPVAIYFFKFKWMEKHNKSENLVLYF